MSEGVVFDTNTLPQYGGLDGPLWMSIAKLCRLRSATVYLPELVLHEALNLRRNRAEVAHAKFIAAQSELSKLFPIEPVYVPDVNDIVDAWEDELRGAFVIVPLDGADAAEALKREALRIRPAREGRGARDSGIWLAALRCATDHDAVFFVSGNTADFGVRRTTELHPDLAEEATAAGVQYLTSIHALLDHLAAKSEVPELSLEVLTDATRAELTDALLRDGSPLSEQFEPEEARLAATIFSSVKPQRAYLVDDGTLVLATATVDLTSDTLAISIDVTLWLTLNNTTGDIESVEVARLVEHENVVLAVIE